MPVSNIRNLQVMRRNIAMRDASPEDVAKTLQALLTEAINLQNSGSSTFQKKALQELQQVRRDMIAGQISAGSKTNQFVGTFSHVIDQIEGLTADNDTGGSSNIDVLKDAIPSTDTMIAALMTANPLLGYGTKLIRDIAGARKRSVAGQREEQKRRLQVLKEQEAFVATQLEDGDVEADKPLDAVDVTYRDTQIVLLEEIRDEIRRLEEMFARTWDTVENVGDNVSEVADQSRENTMDTIDANREERETAERNADLREMDGRYEDTPPIPIADNVDTRAVTEQKKGGFLDMLLGAPLRGLAAVLMGAVTGIGGVLAAFAGGGIIAGLLSPFKAVVSLIVGIGKFAVKMGAKVLVPIMIIKSLYDFFDGFFNAEEMIGQMDMNLGERVLAGISNVVAKLVGLFDDLAELFGFDLFDQEGLTKKIYDFVHSIPENIVKLFDRVTAAVTETVTSLIDGVVETVKAAVEKVVGIFDKIVELFDTIYTNTISSLKAGVEKIPLIGKFFSFDEPELEPEPLPEPTQQSQPVAVDEPVDAAAALIQDQKTLDDIGAQIELIEKKIAAKKAKDTLTEIADTSNLMMIDKQETPLMMMNQTPSDAAARSIQEAEEKASAATVNNVTPVFNAPTSVNNVQNKTVNVGSNTSNQNAGFRRFADMNGMMR